MRRTPLLLYRSLIACFEGESEHASRVALRRALRLPPTKWPACLRETMAAAGVTPDYVMRHLFSIGRFEPDVLEALEAGLPLSVCRLVNGLSSEADRERAMAPFWRALRAGATSVLLPRGVSAQVERMARRLRSSRTAAERSADSAYELEGGWLPPAPEPPTPMAPPGDVWTFPTQSRSDRSAERLPAQVIEGLLATYLQPGDRLVDITAGAGTIGLVASRLGIASWSGDIEPGAAFVHQIDARDMRFGQGTHAPDAAESWPPPASAQALVLHPPTYLAWHDQQEEAAPGLAKVDGYIDYVAAMLSSSLGVLAADGTVWIISRPIREKGRVWLVTSHLSELLTDFELELVGYHVAADERGRDDWHVLVGRRTPGARST